MIKRTSAFIAILFLFINILPRGNAETLKVSDLISESACLMDADTGQVLFEKNMDSRKFPASITKIITAIVAIEKGNLSDIITMSDNAVFSVGRNTSHISLTPGEQITLKDALYAAMLMSANDACNGIAEHIAGSIDAFTSLMTSKAREVGAKNSNFNNANGLKDAEHYTTAYDMAAITRYALKNPVFTELFGTYIYHMPPNNKQPETRNFANQHCMIANTEFNYEGIIGGKAGYTTVAQYTLVTAAERDGRRLIAVVMKSPQVNDKYKDTIKLLDYGFNEFKKLTFTMSEIRDKLKTEDIELTENKLTALVLKGIKKNDIKMNLIKNSGADYISISLKEEAAGMYSKLGEYPYKLIEAVDAMEQTVAEPPDTNPTPPGMLNTVFKFIGITVGVAASLLILLVLVFYIRRRIYIARRKRRRRRRRY